MKGRIQIIRLGLGRLSRILARCATSNKVIAARASAAALAEGTLEEKLPSVFQAEAMLPLQYYEAFRRKHLLEGEKLLMFAILEDAVESYTKYLNATTRRGQKRFREAEEWIDSDDKLWLFSFENVCEALDIEPAYMRRGLHAWKSEHLHVTGEATKSG